MKKKRTWIIIGIVVVAVAAGGVYLATRQTANGQAGRNFLANAATAKVVRTTLANSVDSTGSLNPEAKVAVGLWHVGHGGRREGEGGRSGEAGRCAGVARYDGSATQSDAGRAGLSDCSS